MEMKELLKFNDMGLLVDWLIKNQDDFVMVEKYKKEPVITYDYDEVFSSLEIFVDLKLAANIYCEDGGVIEAYAEAFKEAFKAGYDYAINSTI